MTLTERRSRIAALVATGGMVIALGACHQDKQVVRGGSQGDVTLPQQQARVANATDTTGLPAEGALARVAIGDLAGVGNNTLDADVANPYANDRASVEVGHEYFINMNCASCHGYDLKGGMGPDLTDTYWRYGGSPADIYKSILGTPAGDAGVGTRAAAGGDLEARVVHPVQGWHVPGQPRRSRPAGRPR